MAGRLVLRRIGTRTLDKKRPGGKTRRAMKFWERMPERHDLCAPQHGVLQLRKNEVVLRFLQECQ
jgi:hypothetical protein